MSNSATADTRPTQVRVYSVLLLASGIFMALLGWSASAYYVPALCLGLLALLLWSGRGGTLFKWVLVLNQVGGLVLILALWLGDRAGLGHAKLDVSGVALLLNLLCGGPLAAILGALMLPGLRSGKGLFAWFNARPA
jgi:hypothetical protein